MVPDHSPKDNEISPISYYKLVVPENSGRQGIRDGSDPEPGVPGVPINEREKRPGKDQ